MRVLLRPEGAVGAWLIVDNVTFGPTEVPARATIPPTSPPALPAAEPLPGPLVAAAEATTIPREALPAIGAASAPSPATPPASTRAATPASLRVESVVAAGVADAQQAIRITQILPDPVNPGRDGEYERVELTNLGATPASVEGMTLRDNGGSVMLPALVIPAGGTLVVLARLAAIPGVTALRLPQNIGNGLGNAGDRLVLTSADGRRVDAFSYGDDTTYLIGARIPAPGTGRATERRFGLDGGYRDAVILDQPAPGRARPTSRVAGSPPAGAAPRESVPGITGAPGTWVVLLVLGAGLLGGVAAQRIATIVGERRS